MTQHIEQLGKAMTAIAAVLAFSSTPLLAQETVPPEVDTSVETPAPPDPLAPEPSAADQAVPAAPQPKVETTTTTTRTERATRAASRSPARSAPRRTVAAAPAATAPAPAAAIPTPAPLPAEPQPPATAAPLPPAPVAEPAPAAAAADTSSFDLTSPDTLPIVGAAALGLLAVGGAALVASRRRRRREDEEFEARHQALAALEDEQALELGSAEEIQPAPAFVRAPVHDPVPDTGIRTKIPAQASWEPAADTDFMFRRAGRNAKVPVEHD
jgi:hypothetical protein